MPASRITAIDENKKNMLEWVRENRDFLVVFILSCYLALQGLGNNALWDDEANTALFAENVLETGRLSAWDGRNLVAYKNGAELNQGLVNAFMPPLQYYITALSFLFFGISGWGARILFVLIGLAAVPLIYLTLGELFGKPGRTPLYGALLLGLNVSFLLFIRQARYFSLVILLPLLMYYFFIRYLKTREIKHLSGLLLSSIALFYSNYIAAAAFLETLLVVYLVFHFDRRDVKRIILLAALFLVATLPYIYFFNPFGQDIKYIAAESWESGKAYIFGWNILQLNNLSWLPWVAFIALLALGRKGDKKPPLKEWLLLVAVFLSLLSLYSPRTGIRYILPLLPFCAGLVAFVVSAIRERCRNWTTAILAVLLFTNLLSLGPFYMNVRLDLLGHIHEVHNDYTTPYEAAIQYLSGRTEQDQRVFSTPHYTSYPLMFYLGDRIRVCCLLDRTTGLPQDRINALDSQLFLENGIPDWIVSYGYNENLGIYFNYLAEKGANYTKEAILPVYWKDMTRPEVEWHAFWPVQVRDAEKEGISIYRRVSVPSVNLSGMPGLPVPLEPWNSLMAQ